MARAKSKKRVKRNPSTEGYAFGFHGAYHSKTDAQAKARKVGGWFVKRARWEGGHLRMRYVVMKTSSGVPF